MIRYIAEAVDLAWRWVLGTVFELLDELDRAAQEVFGAPGGLAPVLVAAGAWAVALAGLVGALTTGTIP